MKINKELQKNHGKKYLIIEEIGKLRFSFA